MLKLVEVNKSYGDEQVLSGICMRARQAESLVVLGGSGSGKSTLLRLMAGLEPCDSGQILLNEADITRMGESKLLDFRRQIGVVFQEGALFDSLTVRENVAFRMYDEGGWEEADIDGLVSRLLGFVGLAHTMDLMPSELSGGMRRRVAIARAMAGQPRIMLYDEPTAGLDPITGRTICDLMVALRDLEGITSVVVTHDLNAAHFLASHSARICEDGQMAIEAQDDRACFIHTRFNVLREGRIVFDGNLAQLQQSEDAFIQEFIS